VRPFPSVPAFLTIWASPLTIQETPTRNDFSCFISVYETHFDMSREKEYAALLASPQVYTSQDEDPEVNATDGEPEGMQIGRVKFEDLKAELPDLTKTGISMILDQVSHSILLHSQTPVASEIRPKLISLLLIVPARSNETRNEGFEEGE
jgi:hypothetical protein